MLDVFFVGRLLITDPSSLIVYRTVEVYLFLIEFGQFIFLRNFPLGLSFPMNWHKFFHNPIIFLIFVMVAPVLFLILFICLFSFSQSIWLEFCLILLVISKYQLLAQLIKPCVLSLFSVSLNPVHVFIIFFLLLSLGLFCVSFPNF